MNPVKKFWHTAIILLVCFAVTQWFSPFALAAPALQGNSCTTTPPAPDPSPTVCISNLIVSVDDTSEQNQFYVSWRTQNAESGQVKLVGGETFNDVRGADYRGNTHYVQIKNLAPKQNVTFDIVSGATTFTNNNAHWSVTLGPALPPPSPTNILGRVKNPDGSDADGALVFAQIRNADGQATEGRSALLSTLVDVANGGDFFIINLANARTQNNADAFKFNPTGDRVLIIAADAQGTARQQFDIHALQPPNPPPSIILDSNGTGSAVTATPTELPATATPTLTSTPTETATLEPTVTRTRRPPTRAPTVTPTPDVPPTFESVPTIAPDVATRLASTPNLTSVAMPAGQNEEPARTRVFSGVPVIQPPAPPPNNTALLVALAIVLFVGAILLGLAAYFVSKR